MIFYRTSILEDFYKFNQLFPDISLLGDLDEQIREQTPTPVPCIVRTHGSSASPIRQSPSVRKKKNNKKLPPSNEQQNWDFFMLKMTKFQGTAVSDCGDHLLVAGSELTGLRHEIQLLRERLDQQGQQTRAAVAHARLLQDQLAAETAARVEAQVSVFFPAKFPGSQKDLERKRHRFVFCNTFLPNRSKV